MSSCCRCEIARLSSWWHLAVYMLICFCMDCCCQRICIILHIFISDILVLYHTFDSWSASTVRNDLLGKDHNDIWKRNLTKLSGCYHLVSYAPSAAPSAMSLYTSNRRCVVTGIPLRASSSTCGSGRRLIREKSGPRTFSLPISA